MMDAERAEKVVDSFRHAWEGYRKYAWGSDELNAVTNRGRDK
jgi:mannosyl-oligosaccharide alpha-1,2-mannosidase